LCIAMVGRTRKSVERAGVLDARKGEKRLGNTVPGGGGDGEKKARLQGFIIKRSKSKHQGAGGAWKKGGKRGKKGVLMSKNRSKTTKQGK